MLLVPRKVEIKRIKHVKNDLKHTYKLCIYNASKYYVNDKNTDKSEENETVQVKTYSHFIV